jgi:PAS domain S-box-containing protein
LDPTEDDTIRWVRVRGRPQYDEETDDLIAVRGVVQDITDERQRDQDLRLQRSAIKQAPVGITISDATQPDNPIIYANDGFMKLTGYSMDRAMGENCRFLQGERTSEETRTEIREAVDAEEFIRTRILNYRANGTPFWNRLTISPVTGEDDEEVTHYVGIQEDVTAEERRDRLIEVLNRVLRHNIRNGMTVIQGYASTIAEQHDGELAQMAETIRDKSIELSELSEKARAFQESIGEQESLGLRDICEDVEAVAEVLQREYPESEIRAELKNCGQILGSEQVLVALKELGQNAIVHGDDPVTYRVLDGEDAGIMVEVADAGSGLPVHERSVLQEGQENPLKHGSGLGLWTVNWIITGMGGEVTTAVNNGTTVTLHFPPVSNENVLETPVNRQSPLGFIQSSSL